jgi:hypothetical protein
MSGERNLIVEGERTAARSQEYGLTKKRYPCTWLGNKNKKVT